MRRLPWRPRRDLAVRVDRLAEVVDETRGRLAEPASGLRPRPAHWRRRTRATVGRIGVELVEGRARSTVSPVSGRRPLAEQRGGDREPADVERGLADVVVGVLQSRGREHAVVEVQHRGGVAQRIGAGPDEQIVGVVVERRLVAERDRCSARADRSAAAASAAKPATPERIHHCLRRRRAPGRRRPRRAGSRWRGSRRELPARRAPRGLLRGSRRAEPSSRTASSSGSVSASL